MRPMRGFDGEKCRHQGVDIGGDSVVGGVGDKVYSIVKSRVYFIGTPSPIHVVSVHDCGGAASRRNAADTSFQLKWMFRATEQSFQ